MEPFGVQGAGEQRNHGFLSLKGQSLRHRKRLCAEEFSLHRNGGFSGQRQGAPMQVKRNAGRRVVNCNVM